MRQSGFGMAIIVKQGILIVMLMAVIAKAGEKSQFKIDGVFADEGWKKYAERVRVDGENVGSVVVPHADHAKIDYKNQMRTPDISKLHKYQSRLGLIALYMRLFKKFGGSMCAAFEPDDLITKFPRRIPKPLNAAVHDHCTHSVLDCIDAVYDLVKASAWFQPELFKDLSISSKSDSQNWFTITSSLYRLHTQPFVSISDHCSFVASVSYYLCWFTMQRFSVFAHLPYCEQTVSIHKSYAFEHDDSELDAVDEVPYRCAQFSFCPNPCCRQKMINTDCTVDKEINPCRFLQDKRCFVEGSRNDNFLGLLRNNMNASCHCGHGFEYDNHVMACMDIDECMTGKYVCTIKNQICANTLGSYLCVCKVGFKRKGDQCIELIVPPFPRGAATRLQLNGLTPLFLALVGVIAKILLIS